MRRSLNRRGLAGVVWATPETAAVHRALTGRRTLAHTRRLVEAWNKAESGRALGIDLSEQLRKLMVDRVAVEKVNWYQLADTYAMFFCGVTEAELMRRYQLAYAKRERRAVSR